MLRHVDQGQASLSAIVILLGIVITSVWVWKRLSLESQEYVIDQAIPLAAAVLGIGVLVMVVIKKIRRLGMDVLVMLLNKRWRRMVEIVLQVLSNGFFGVLVIHGIPLVERTMRQFSSAIRIPMGYIYASIPAGSALILLFALERMVRVWNNQGDPSDATPA